MSGTPSSPSGGVEVACRQLGMTYDVDGETVTALSEINLVVEPGEQIALIGPSGSGKSTLTTLLAGLRRPRTGTITIGDRDLTQLDERGLLKLRRTQLGIVLQNPSRSLLPYGTAEDNILFAQRAVPRSERKRLPAPAELLEQVGLGPMLKTRAGGLSGGEQQRLAVAVGMANNPSLLLADEPTSQLDQHSRDIVVELIVRLAGASGTTAIVVTHDREVANALQRAVGLHEGRIASDVRAAGRPPASVADDVVDRGAVESGAVSDGAATMPDDPGDYRAWRR